jgi:hypothetical protein
MSPSDQMLSILSFYDRFLAIFGRFFENCYDLELDLCRKCAKIRKKYEKGPFLLVPQTKHR